MVGVDILAMARARAVPSAVVGYAVRIVGPVSVAEAVPAIVKAALSGHCAAPTWAVCCTTRKPLLFPRGRSGYVSEEGFDLD